MARLEDLQRDERALDARIASDLAAIETARQRVADLPEAVARAKMSATIHAGTILESRSTKQTAELGVEHERLTDQITIWDQTAQARSSAEVEQRERLYDLRCRAEEAITTLQQQLARIDATERQAREQHGTALLAAFERDLAAADARRDAAEQDLHAAEATRTRLAAAADRRLEPWPVLLQLAQRRLAGATTTPPPRAACWRRIARSWTRSRPCRTAAASRPTRCGAPCSTCSTRALSGSCSSSILTMPAPGASANGSLGTGGAWCRTACARKPRLPHRLRSRHYAEPTPTCPNFAQHTDVQHVNAGGWTTVQPGSLGAWGWWCCHTTWMLAHF